MPSQLCQNLIGAQMYLVIGTPLSDRNITQAMYIIKIFLLNTQKSQKEQVKLILMMF